MRNWEARAGIPVGDRSDADLYVMEVSKKKVIIKGQMNMSLPKELIDRVKKHKLPASEISRVALEAACKAAETGEMQTLSVGWRYSHELFIG